MFPLQQWAGEEDAIFLCLSQGGCEEVGSALKVWTDANKSCTHQMLSVSICYFIYSFVTELITLLYSKYPPKLHKILVSIVIAGFYFRLGPSCELHVALSFITYRLFVSCIRWRRRKKMDLRPYPAYPELQAGRSISNSLVILVHHQARQKCLQKLLPLLFFSFLSTRWLY